MSPTANDEGRERGRGRGGSLAAMPSSPKTLHYVEENRAHRLEERGGGGQCADYRGCHIM